MSRKSKKRKAAEAAAKIAAQKAASEKAAVAAKKNAAVKKAKKTKKKLKRRLFVLVIGSGIALAASEDLRNKVLDALFGAEEEFQYSSTTAPSTPPSATSTSA